MSIATPRGASLLHHVSREVERELARDDELRQRDPKREASEHTQRANAAAVEETVGRHQRVQGVAHHVSRHIAAV